MYVSAGGQYETHMVYCGVMFVLCELSVMCAQNVCNECLPGYSTQVGSLPGVLSVMYVICNVCNVCNVKCTCRWAAQYTQVGSLLGVLATKHLSLQTDVAPKVTIGSFPFNSIFNFNLLSVFSLIQLSCSLPFWIHLTSLWTRWSKVNLCFYPIRTYTLHSRHRERCLARVECTSQRTFHFYNEPELLSFMLNPNFFFSFFEPKLSSFTSNPDF